VNVFIIDKFSLCNLANQHLCCFINHSDIDRRPYVFSLIVFQRQEAFARYLNLCVS